MSADVVAVLVVPAPNDPGRLLSRGVCGSSPPVAHEAGRWSTPTWMEGRDPDGPMFNALPLWWSGELVPEGWWRAWCVWTRPAGRNAAPCPVNPTLDDVRALADELSQQGLVSSTVFLARDGGSLRVIDDPSPPPEVAP